MPKTVINGQVYVTCINAPPARQMSLSEVMDPEPSPLAAALIGSGGERPHIMVPMAAYGSLPVVMAPLAPNLPARQTESMMPLRIYACDLCGYVEMYLGAVTDPGVWRHG